MALVEKPEACTRCLVVHEGQVDYSWNNPKASEKGGSMTEPKDPTDKVLEFAVPQEGIERQIEDWLQRIVESNDELVVVVERIRDSYRALLAGKPVKDDDEILAQVESALQNAARAKTIV